MRTLSLQVAAVARRSSSVRISFHPHCCRTAGAHSCGATKHASTVFSWAYEFVFWIYPGVSGLQFRTFVCQELDDGTSWLRADLSIDCKSVTHTGFWWYAVIMVFIYPIGTPVLYYGLLSREKKGRPGEERHETSTWGPFLIKLP